ncbi:hypothetical protein CV093_11030 [Oceanobacillus sp. 143]|uniref:Uncharacterized protein n=1 Tax=Oceanobacillus zhaokaii TaxID=2052660 RepID=A0A345PH42_9BACI|nr:hypothetical protein [Oceanobacillus zhaokaii]AXI09322.1 hypothetical protein CUC15_10485 [Oceanobacillus zhaokaii]QGS68803.1 hypothetical protein CV093_11030 [Oceanobacillus sp. 143]
MFAVKELDSFVNGVNKEDVELSVERLLDQLRRIDQKLRMKVENEIKSNFHKQQQEVLATEAILIQLINNR